MGMTRHRFRAHAHLGELTTEMCKRLHRAHLLREPGDLYRQPLRLSVSGLYRSSARSSFGGQVRPAVHRQAARRYVPVKRFQPRT